MSETVEKFKFCFILKLTIARATARFGADNRTCANCCAIRRLRGPARPLAENMSQAYFLIARAFLRFKSFAAYKNPTSYWSGVWCGQQDLNLHGCPPDPKSGASANSAMSASIISISRCGSKINRFTVHNNYGKYSRGNVFA